jgi:hypothetical protein
MADALHRGHSVSGDERAQLVDLFDETVLKVWKNTPHIFDTNLMRSDMAAPGEQTRNYRIFGGNDSDNTDGLTDAVFHTPGEQILFGKMVQGTVSITIDDLLYHAMKLPVEDLNLTTWPLVAETVEETIRLVVHKLERRAMQLGIQAARTTSTDTDLYPSSVQVIRTGTAATSISHSTLYPRTDTGASRFEADLGSIRYQWDEINIPQEGRYVLVSPYMAQVLRGDSVAARLYHKDFGGSDLSQRVVANVEGFDVIVTNFMPSTNISTGLSKYQVDASFAKSGGGDGQPVALCLYGGMESSLRAIGALKAKPLTATAWTDEDQISEKTRADIHLGMGTVATWCAAEVCCCAA